MIYLIDETLSDTSHSKYITDIIKRHTDVEIELIEITTDITYKQIAKLITELGHIVKLSDIVLCPWAVAANYMIDEMFNDLSEQCWVVVAAGNYNQDIENWSPARADKVTTVACLNKSGVKALLSNYSETKELIWVPGTNYDVGWKNSSGTSVAAAVYTAFLAEAIKQNDITVLDNLLELHKNNVFGEINNK